MVQWLGRTFGVEEKLMLEHHWREDIDDVVDTEKTEHLVKGAVE